MRTRYILRLGAAGLALVMVLLDLYGTMAVVTDRSVTKSTQEEINQYILGIFFAVVIIACLYTVNALLIDPPRRQPDADNRYRDRGFDYPSQPPTHDPRGYVPPVHSFRAPDTQGAVPLEPLQ